MSVKILVNCGYEWEKNFIQDVNQKILWCMMNKKGE